MTEIALTDEQCRALEAEGGQPITVVDPTTHQRFVLLTVELYERLQPFPEQLPAPTPPEPDQPIAPLMLRSQQAFWQDLPGLLQLSSPERQWVAYHGEKRIGFGRTDLDIYRECLRRGLERGQFYVGKLEADPEGLPPWGTAPIVRSLYEFSDAPPPAADHPSA